MEKRRRGRPPKYETQAERIEANRRFARERAARIRASRPPKPPRQKKPSPPPKPPRPRHPWKKAASMAAWKKTAKGRVSMYRFKDRAKGREFDLTEAWWEANIFEGCCFYCGHTEDLGADRLDNSIGHTQANCVPCCEICNRARNTLLSVDEMKILGETIAKIRSCRKNPRPETRLKRPKYRNLTP